MRSHIAILLLFPLSLGLFSCGSKQPTETGASELDSAGDAGPTEEEAVASAQTRIKDWLGKDLTARIALLGKDLGKNVALKLARDSEVAGEAKALSKRVFKDKEVKKQLEKVSDKATAGLGNKLTLGWKALQAGGIKAYKEKIRADARRVALDVLIEHIQNDVLKDERTAKLLKDFAPALKMQGKVVAVSVQEHLSAKVTKKVLAIALTISAAGDKAKMADRVEAWIERCEDHAKDEIEQLILDVAELPAVQQAVRSLALDVLTHERTEAELTVMARALLDDGDVNRALVRVYEAAAFEKGDAQIRSAIVNTISMPAVDTELFAAMERLATAEGAGPMMARHAASASEDPAMADLIEDFVVSVLEACGNPIEANQ
ncbi:MAG: hypothetical protein QNJ97_04130 [Myxococcota bacterium]|nr:hypothetical protein [Myxococcota bacterium]